MRGSGNGGGNGNRTVAGILLAGPAGASGINEMPRRHSQPFRGKTPEIDSIPDGTGPGEHAYPELTVTPVGLEPLEGNRADRTTGNAIVPSAREGQVNIGMGMGKRKRRITLPIAPLELPAWADSDSSGPVAVNTPQARGDLTVRTRIIAPDQPELSPDVDLQKWGKIAKNLAGYNVEEGMNTIMFNLDAFLKIPRPVFFIPLVLGGHAVNIIVTKIREENFIALCDRAPEDLSDIPGLTSGIDLTRKAFLRHGDSGKTLFAMQLLPSEVEKLRAVSEKIAMKTNGTGANVDSENADKTAETSLFKEILENGQSGSEGFDPRIVAAGISLAVFDKHQNDQDLECMAWTNGGELYRAYIRSSEHATYGLPDRTGFIKAGVLAWEGYEVTIFRQGD